MAYRLLPRIVEKITSTMAELDVQPLDPKRTPEAAAKQRARVYMTPVTTRRGGTLWFKSSLQDWAWVRETLREEIKIYRLFTDYEKKFRPVFTSPTIIAHHDDRRGHVWFLRKYWDGAAAGDMNEEFGFSDQFFRRVSPTIMARALQDVREMSTFVRRRFRPATHSLRWYFRDWEYYRKTFWRPLVAHPLHLGWQKRNVDILEGWLLEQRVFLARHAFTFTHGDLYPNNIMLSPGARRPLVFFDWELSHLNIPTFDAVMIYLQAWRRPVWQAALKKEFLSNLGDTPSHRKLWMLAELSLATRLGAFAFHRLTNYLPERYPVLPKKFRPLLLKMYVAMSQQLRDLLDVIR